MKRWMMTMSVAGMIATSTAWAQCQSGGYKAHQASRTAVAGESRVSADVVDTAVRAGKFRTLVNALLAAELDQALRGEGPFTVLAPTDQAFAKLGHDQIEALLKPENRSNLQQILKYHVIAGRVTARQAAAAGQAETLAERPLKIDIRDGRLTINDANVIASDVAAANGVIHVIDRVLIPS
jgi:uncharacterized surface protein with fasciclin (FAS1) repeats